LAIILLINTFNKSLLGKTKIPARDWLPNRSSVYKITKTFYSETGSFFTHNKTYSVHKVRFTCKTTNNGIIVRRNTVLHRRTIKSLQLTRTIGSNDGREVHQRSDHVMTPVGLEVVHFDAFQYWRHDDGLSGNDYKDIIYTNSIRKQIFQANAIARTNNTTVPINQIIF